MLKFRSLKVLCLIAISVLFCYRAALLSQREYKEELSFSCCEAEAYSEAVAQLEPELLSFLNSIFLHEKTATAPHNAGATEAAANKLNNQLKHHAYMVTRYLEKGECEEKSLQKIERELLIIEQAAEKLGITKLLRHDLIAEIKKAIEYLKLSGINKKREKVNKI